MQKKVCTIFGTLLKSDNQNDEQIKITLGAEKEKKEKKNSNFNFRPIQKPKKSATQIVEDRYSEIIYSNKYICKRYSFIIKVFSIFCNKHFMELSK